MSFLFDLWPFNVASGPAFLLLYAIFGASAFVLGHVLSRAIVARFDRSDVEAPSIRPGTYRSSATPPALAIGIVPQREHVWTVAYLRDGASGVREGLIAAAIAAGWVKLEDKESVRIGPSAPVDDPILESFRRSFTEGARPITEVRAIAGAVAREALPRIQAAVADAGFAPGWTAWARHATIGALGALVLLIGVVRCVRAETLARPYGLLCFEMILFAILVATLGLARPQGRSRAAQAYLDWLRAATRSMEAALAGGQRLAPCDASVCIAVAGYRHYERTPLFVGTSVLVFGSSAIAGGSSGCSSGGGGCGGSGCGGGCGG